MQGVTVERLPAQCARRSALSIRCQTDDGPARSHPVHLAQRASLHVSSAKTNNVRTGVAAQTPMNQKVVHMCGSGVYACHNLLAMEVAGLHGSRAFVPSWSGWSSDPVRPVATGDA